MSLAVKDCDTRYLRRILFLGSFLFFAMSTGVAYSADQFPLKTQSSVGRYISELKPLPDIIPLRETHAWSVSLQRQDQSAEIPLRIEISGGMPRHGHGLPSAPKISHHFGAGKYQIDGLLFNMSGIWQLQLDVFDELGWDSLLFTFPVREAPAKSQQNWSDSELGLLSALHVCNLQNAVPKVQETGNKVALNEQAAELGQHLFYDQSLSPKGIACSHCHQPESYFTDGNKTSIGIAALSRNAPSLVGVGHQKWFYWDGRRDSLWSQALVPFEAPSEMGSSRVAVLQTVMANQQYRERYKEIFKSLPDISELNTYPDSANPLGSEVQKKLWKRIPRRARHEINRHFSNIGKVIAAYIRKLQISPSRFDHFVSTLLVSGEESANTILNHDEQAGLRLFISGQTRCLNCHNGPLFSNQGFHNIGTAVSENGATDFGRALGIQSALLNEFNCRSRYF